MSQGDDDTPMDDDARARETPLPGAAFHHDCDLDETDDDDEEGAADARAAAASSTPPQDDLNALLNSLPGDASAPITFNPTPQQIPGGSDITNVADAGSCTQLTGRAQFDQVAKAANQILSPPAQSSTNVEFPSLPSALFPPHPAAAPGTPLPFPCSQGELSGQFDQGPSSSIAKLLQDQASQQAATAELQNAVRGTMGDIKGLTAVLEAQGATLTNLTETVGQMKTGMDDILAKLTLLTSGGASSSD